MCEYSGRLVAWLDRELPEEEATNVQWHVGQCAECRQAVSAYEKVSSAFLICYQAAQAAGAPRKPRHQRPFIGGAVAGGAVAAAATPPQAVTHRQPCGRGRAAITSSWQHRK